MLIDMKFFKLFLGLLMLSLFSSCHDCDDSSNPDCSNYNPCNGVEITNADFGFFHKSIGADLWFEIGDDTIWSSIHDEVPLVYFKAKNKADSLVWKIGHDSREFRDSVFFLDFSGFEGTYNVQLIAFKQPSADCYPNDDGVDTVNQTFVIKKVKTAHDMPIHDFYYQGVVLDHPNDTITVDLASNSGWISGLPIPCVLGLELPYFSKGRYLQYDPEANWNPDCHFKFFGREEDDHQTLTIDFSYDEGGKRIERRFVGLKQ